MAMRFGLSSTSGTIVWTAGQRPSDLPRRSGLPVDERGRVAVDEYLRKIEDLLWPDLIVVGGGISKKSDKFFSHLTARTKVVAAQMLNEGGIVGAALACIPDRSPAHAAELN